MLSDLLGNGVILISVLVFVAVLLMLESAFLLWRSSNGAAARKLRERVDAFAPSSGQNVRHLFRDGGSAGAQVFDAAIRRSKAGRSLEDRISQAGLRLSSSAIVLWSVLLGAAGWFLPDLVLPGFVASLFTAIAMGSVPIVYVQWKRSRRLRNLERQLPDALDLIARALRAGHAFSAALKMAGDELPEPIASEFRAVHDEVAYGITLEEALTNFSDRIPVMDVRYFVVAVLVQRESGGNLTEILSNLSRLIRERFKLFARVRVLSAEGRLSGWVMGLLPFGLAALLNFFNPKFMSPLWTDPIGITITQYVLVVMAVGAILLRRITQIRV
ncbi:type II secretion system F family protein [Ramlibacter rhizophilus]|uniref:Type II secretion system F family protein n=1 Tax=Ramlibacter rhizophilus TaxID=1781167 RepID=A0A4Z0BDY8_9BURK|nr:type II secretion system F family protein [Ramlibacter rhizophilus]TFY96901.1 type II secretion system F family protein [Ramlibacter rhizophilus]